jgi:hypothetical protein
MGASILPGRITLIVNRLGRTVEGYWDAAVGSRGGASLFEDENRLY